VPSTQHIWLQNAAADALRATGLHLRDPMRIGDLAAHDADRVGMAGLQQEAAFSGVRIWLSDWTRMCFTLRLISAVSGSVSRSPRGRAG